jgi:hypothetical protein
MLDTARKYRKIFMRAGLIILGAFMVFTVIDTFTQFTRWGASINNVLWPPSFKIDTLPSGAKIEIIRDKTDMISKMGYRSRTPSYIKEIHPGIYTLKLYHEDFKEIVRKITVFSGKNGVVSIAGAKLINGVYTIPFEIMLEVNSVPDGADFFLDDLKIGQTPAHLPVGI